MRVAALPWLRDVRDTLVPHRELPARGAQEVEEAVDPEADVPEGSFLEPCLHLTNHEGEVVAMPLVKPGRAAGLTGAELRLLPLLATHLSFREIGVKLFVSRNTIKTQAISVYRKLGVSNRSAAIERAAEIGLVDPAVAGGLTATA